VAVSRMAFRSVEGGRGEACVRSLGYLVDGWNGAAWRVEIQAGVSQCFGKAERCDDVGRVVVCARADDAIRMSGLLPGRAVWVGVCTVGVRNATSATTRRTSRVRRRRATVTGGGRWVTGESQKSGRRQYVTVHGDVKLYTETGGGGDEVDRGGGAGRCRERT